VFSLHFESGGFDSVLPDGRGVGVSGHHQFQCPDQQLQGQAVAARLEDV